MQMMKCKQNVGSVKSGCVLLKSPNLREVEEELTSWAVLKHEKEFAIALKCIIHFHNERMSDIFL
jgi:hypothetical protein